jgi:hypothetical protein
MNESTTKKHQWRIRLAATAGAVALVAGGGAVAANAASTSSTATSATKTCAVIHRAQFAVASMPTGLRNDITALKGESKTDRKKDVATIEAKVLSGGYGKKAEAATKRFGFKRLRKEAKLPAALVTDLKALKAAKTSAAKVTILKSTTAKAVAGDFGARIEKVAKRVEKSKAYATCVA